MLFSSLSYECVLTSEQLFRIFISIKEGKIGAVDLRVCTEVSRIWPLILIGLFF